MTKRGTLTRCAAPPAAALVLALSLASPASAHVGISASSTAAGSYSVLTVGVPHGCDGSATTRVEVQVPEAILSVTPTRNPFWTVEKKIVKLAQPATDAHGNEVTERVGSVVYTATTPLPEGVRDTFELSLKLPEEEGDLAFPTIQTCEQGETAWVEVPAMGGSDEELDHPAPTVTVTAAEGGRGHAPVVAAATTTSSVEPGDDADGTMAALGLGAGLLGLLAGGTSLVLVRRRA